MKLHFSEDVRAALGDAAREAHRLGHDYVGTEHLLLGLLLVESAAVQQHLSEAGIDASAVRRVIDEMVRPGTSTRVGELPFTSRSKRVLEFAMAEAARDARSRGVMGMRATVEAEHLLAGLRSNPSFVSAQALAAAGVPGASLQRAAQADRPAISGFRVVIDDAADRSIYEQIVARIQEAVATGELKPGTRLPAVRQLADELDIAPGTVARAYAELERRSVVVTEGARGTRVAEQRSGTQPEAVDPMTLTGLLRPVAVAAFHMGAGAADLRTALEEAMKGIYDRAG